MTSNGCRICDSPLKTEIERKDSIWRADRTIRWARQNGLRINRVTLARHRADHLRGPAPRVEPSSPFSSRDSKNLIPSKTTAKSGSSPGGDLEFLDTVRDKVFDKLLAGDFDLKIESAFKAIEIKYKIADESANEKLLLEILSEIRSDELSRRQPAPDNRRR